MFSFIVPVAQAATTWEPEVDKSIAGGVLALIGGIFFLMLLFGILFFVLWLVMLIHAVQTDEAEFTKLQSGEKNLWLVLLIVSLVFGFYWIVAVVYYFVIYRNVKTVSSSQKNEKPKK